MSLTKATKSFQPVPAGEIKTPIHEKIFIWILVGGAAFSHAQFIIQGVSLADLFFACSLVICFLSLSMNGSLHYIPRCSIYIILLLIWALIGGLLADSASFFAFSKTEFVRSFVKLSFYGIGAVLLSSYIWKIEIDVIGKTVLNILTFNALIAIYIYIAMSFPIGLPYKFFWFRQGGPLTAGYFGGFESGLVRARGIFSEPSSLGIFQTLGLTFLYFKSHAIANKLNWKYAAIIISILLTFSLSAYFLFGVMLIFFILKLRHFKQLFSYTLIIVLTLLFLATIMYNSFQETIVTRLISVFQGKDNSATVRLIATWEASIATINISPIFGSGLGNLESTIPAIGSGLKYKSILTENSQGWNILAYVLGTMGIVGLFIFGLFIVNLIGRTPAAGTVFLCSMFATGRFLDPIFWIFYILFSKEYICYKYS